MSIKATIRALEEFNLRSINNYLIAAREIWCTISDTYLAGVRKLPVMLLGKRYRGGKTLLIEPAYSERERKEVNVFLSVGKNFMSGAVSQLT